tara:strand:+ start:3043 stop:3291 length:249 start_codon:yes stop_codon:yes gene_type:complete
MKLTKSKLKQIIKEELETVNEIDLFGKKKAASDLESAWKTRHDELADIHNRLKDALGDPNKLQQTASGIIKDLALKFRNMDQ